MDFEMRFHIIDGRVSQKVVRTVGGRAMNPAALDAELHDPI
jgi:hypothetical protein